MGSLLHVVLPAVTSFLPIALLFAAALFLRWAISGVVELRRRDRAYDAEAERVGALARKAENERLLRAGDIPGDR